MALSVNPVVNDWNKQTGAFIISFRAYDDNGQKCRNKNFSIQYGITTDGSNPDLSQLLRVYSDASGLVTLRITEPCVISLYVRYQHDITNPSAGEYVEMLAENYKITYAAMVAGFTVSYPEKVPITDNYNPLLLNITGHKTDGSTFIVDPATLTFTDLQIQNVGVNNKQVEYYDPLFGTTWTINFDIIGICKVLNIEANFVGERKVMGDWIAGMEIELIVTMLTAIDVEEIIKPIYGIWNFLDIPVITETNLGIFNIEYEGHVVQVSVPYDSAPQLRLRVWYEGVKIEVGNTYNPEDLVILLERENGNRYRLRPNQCNISSKLVSEEGWNWFEIAYITSYTTLTQKYPVPGIIRKNYIDLLFKVLYICNDEEIDVTEEFKEIMTIDDMVYVSWPLFSKHVSSTGKYGLYKVTAPAKTGLSNEYSTEWAVICNNETTLKATIIKIYNEEE